MYVVDRFLHMYEGWPSKLLQLLHVDTLQNVKSSCYFQLKATEYSLFFPFQALWKSDGPRNVIHDFSSSFLACAP